MSVLLFKECEISPRIAAGKVLLASSLSSLHFLPNTDCDFTLAFGTSGEGSEALGMEQAQIGPVICVKVVCCKMVYNGCECRLQSKPQGS